MTSTQTNLLTNKRIKKHPRFPNNVFYNNGKCQIIRETIKTKYGETIKNPNYLRFVVPGIHYKTKKLYCSLIDVDGKKVNIRPHTITAKLFIKNPDNKPIVTFKDNNPLNIHFSNLIWVTQGELNKIQHSTGKRNMLKAAKQMRERRKSWDNNGRKSNTTVIKGKVISLTDTDNKAVVKIVNKKSKFLKEQKTSKLSIAKLAAKFRIPKYTAYKYINQNK